MVQLMDLLTPPPSVVNAFAQHYAKEPQEATEYFTNFVKNGTVIEQEEPVVFQQSMEIFSK